MSGTYLQVALGNNELAHFYLKPTELALLSTCSLSTVILGGCPRLCSSGIDGLYFVGRVCAFGG